MSVSAANPSQTIPTSVLDAANQSTSGATGSAATAGPSDPDSAQSLENNFMTLLVTQLKNQDPTNPINPSDLTSELAQINTLSGIQDLNSTLQSINGQVQSSQYLEASALIGKGVLVPGSQVLVGSNGAATPIGFELKSDASDVKVSIANKAGKVVQSVDLGAQNAGTQSFNWDGSIIGGGEAPAGAYTVTVTATDNGAKVSATGLQYALVTGVSGNSNGPLLDLGGTGNTVALNEVRQIFPSSTVSGDASDNTATGTAGAQSASADRTTTGSDSPSLVTD